MELRDDPNLILAYVEGELAGPEAQRLDERCRLDPALAELVRDLRDDRAALRGLPRQSPASSPAQAALGQLERQLLLDPQAGPAHAASRLTPAPTYRVLRFTAYAGLAAALALTTAVVVVNLTGTPLEQRARDLAVRPPASAPAPAPTTTPARAQPPRKTLAQATTPTPAAIPGPAASAAALPPAETPLFDPHAERLPALVDAPLSRQAPIAPAEEPPVLSDTFIFSRAATAAESATRTPSTESAVAATANAEMDLTALADPDDRNSADAAPELAPFASALDLQRLLLDQDTLTITAAPPSYPRLAVANNLANNRERRITVLTNAVPTASAYWHAIDVPANALPTVASPNSAPPEPARWLDADYWLADLFAPRSPTPRIPH